MISEEEVDVIIKENMNQKRMKDYIDALIFRTKDGDETLAHLRAELVAKLRFIMTLYDLRECWECDEHRPCKPERCLKLLTPKFTLNRD
ncbi:hypothetical protein B566_EDAN018036 [Ephemera danica]|nr:hypothetical protein B566_EDAN018036 [Ephemera danica]